MTIRDLVERLEDIEANCSGSTREDVTLLIDDLIKFDMEMDKLMTKGLKKFSKELEKDFLQHLIMDGIKSGSVGDA